MFAVIAAILIVISSSLVAHDLVLISRFGFSSPVFDKYRAGVVSIKTCFSLVRFLAVQETLSH